MLYKTFMRGGLLATLLCTIGFCAPQTKAPITIQNKQPIYIHEDGSYCDGIHDLPYYFVYNKKDKSYTQFDILTFKKPKDFTPSKEKKLLKKVEKQFHASQSDPKFKNTRVTNIAVTPKSNPDLLYFIAEPLEH